jgi:cytochrome c-type biogenesis protein CcmH
MQIEFYFFALLLVALAILFVVLPLIRRHESLDASQQRARQLANIANYRSEKRDIEAQLENGDISEAEAAALLAELDRTLLEDSDERINILEVRRGHWWAIPLIFVPLISLVVYHRLGGLDEILLQDTLINLQMPESIEEQRVEILALHERIQQVAAKHGKRKPDYWVMAAQTAMNVQDYSAAAGNYAQLAQQYPDDAEVIAYWAQAEFMAGQRQMSPKIEGLVQRALALDPEQSTVLGLVGIAAFESGNYAQAVEAWRKIVSRLPAGSPDAEVIQQGIENAVALAASEGQVIPEVDETQGVAVDVVVDLSASLNSQGLVLSDSAVLFIFAQAIDGPRMPLAVARLAADTVFPVRVRLSDSMAMTPAMRLSQFPNVQISARLSQSGTVTPGSGDYQVSSPAQAAPALDAPQVQIVIDQQLP